MNANPEPHGPAEPDFDEYDYEDEGFGDTLPVRPRRPFLTKWTAGLMALVLGAVGFYVGVRVEKSKIPATSSAGSALSRLFSGAGGTTSRTGAGGFASRFGGAFAGLGGNETIGSVSSVNGNTLYVTETSGNTVKVKLSGDTTISKSESVSKAKIYPGDQVVITGTTGSGGTVDATQVSDSGASSTSSTSSSSSSSAPSSSGGNASSAISSLFGKT